MPPGRVRPRRMQGTAVRWPSGRFFRLMVAFVTLLLVLCACGLPPEGDQESATTQTSLPPVEPPVPTCARGTRSLGHHTGYSNRHRQRVLLCAVEGLPSESPESTPGNRYYLPGARGEAVVNQWISDGVAALLRQAKRQGVSLKVTSSFRSHARQRALCRQDPGCSKGDHRLVTLPGYSSHQMGLALDFHGTGTTGTRSCTTRRARDPDSRVWRLLNQHADRFGLQQYAAESWHWESAQLPTSCAPLRTGTVKSRALV